MFRPLASCAALMLITACATVESGNKFDTAVAASFTEGTTSRSDVERSLGKPTSVTTTKDGGIALIYVHSIGHGNGLTGKATATATTAAFLFDAAGKLVQKTITSQASTAD